MQLLVCRFTSVLEWQNFISEKYKITGMKYLMQILFGLILLQLLLSCNYSKSRDVLWMKENFKNNAELFFDVTNLFNNSIPINLKKENYVIFNINDKNNSIEISIINKKVINGERVTKKANSLKSDNKKFNQLLESLGWSHSKADSIRNMLQRIKCNTIRTVDYKYFNIEIYNSSNLSYSYLHLKHSVESSNIKTISNNTKYGNQFSISVTNPV